MDKEILKIALNTKNLSSLDNHTHSIKLKNSTCGDEIKVYLIMRKEKITNFKYEGESCIYCQASASLLSDDIKNKTKEEIIFLLKKSNYHLNNKKNKSNKKWKKILKIMHKGNTQRKECLLLPIKATLKALKN